MLLSKFETLLLCKNLTNENFVSVALKHATKIQLHATYETGNSNDYYEERMCWRRMKRGGG